MRVALLLLVACSGSEGSPDCGPSSGLVATTTDFSVGALAAVSDEGELTDRIASVSGDPIVRYQGDWLWQINRSSADTLRRYTPGDLCRPDWEIALPRGANAHDVAVVGDEVWVTLYEEPLVSRRSLADGAALGEIDLTALADADGIPELHDILERDGRVFVSAQRFDRSQTNWTSDSGRVAEIGSDGVIWQVDVGPSPRLSPLEDGRLLVASGTYGGPDGGVAILDPDAIALDPPLLTDRQLAQDLEVVVPVGGAALVLASDFDLGDGGLGAVHCLDLETGSTVELERDSGWFVDAVAAEDTVWVGVRRGWGAGTEPGLFEVDPVGCSVINDRIPTALEPYSLTFVSNP